MTRTSMKPQHAVCRAVKRLSKAQPTQGGAGVSLFRAVGQPALRELDPFLLLDEMHSERAEDYTAGLPSHPHRGFETLSYMVSGETDGLLWGYQLWVNLPAAHKMDDPRYLDIAADSLPTLVLNDDGFIKVIAGRGIAASPGPVVRDDIDLVFLDISLAPHSRLKQTLPAGHTALAYVAEGQVEFGCGSFNSPATLGGREVAVFDDGNAVTAITDDVSARFLLIAGKPIGEPIVRAGPFVMNTKAEIATAIHDYQRGALA